MAAHTITTTQARDAIVDDDATLVSVDGLFDDFVTLRFRVECNHARCGGHTIFAHYNGEHVTLLDAEGDVLHVTHDDLPLFDSIDLILDTIQAC